MTERERYDRAVGRLKHLLKDFNVPFRQAGNEHFVATAVGFSVYAQHGLELLPAIIDTLELSHGSVTIEPALAGSWWIRVEVSIDIEDYIGEPK